MIDIIPFVITYKAKASLAAKLFREAFVKIQKDFPRIYHQKNSILDEQKPMRHSNKKQNKEEMQLILHRPVHIGVYKLPPYS